jgi:hypothetical protein
LGFSLISPYNWSTTLGSSSRTFPGSYQLTFGDIELLNNKSFDQSELIRLALAGLDTEIAALQEKRAQLAALTNEQSASAAVKAATPKQKTGKMSAEARAKISAAATARWAKVKKAKAEAEKSAVKKAPSKKSPVKAQKASKKGKKAPAKKGSKAPAASSTETI